LADSWFGPACKRDSSRNRQLYQLGQITGTRGNYGCGDDDYACPFCFFAFFLRLVCRVPNLRGHDAQLLVACAVTEAETLESMSPQQLLSLVGPYSDTKEGMKIVRSGKKPDLAEVSDWIKWARHTRSLAAA